MSLDLAPVDQIDALERQLLAGPQVECPVAHHFGPGIYIREVTIPAGTLVIGHAHKGECLNIMLKGRLILRSPDGDQREVSAPLIMTTGPGRKVAYALEDTVWQNVFATEETDIARLEELFVDKSDGWLDAADREDYRAFLAETGISHEHARAVSVNEADQCPLPDGSPVRVAHSAIDGLGVFLTAAVEADTVVGPARLDGKRTPLGRFTNHAAAPNARMELLPSGDVDLVASRRIEAGAEVTIDYRLGVELARLTAEMEI